MGSLDGKVALVTGGGQGIGKGVALALASEGASLVLTGRDESKLIVAAQEVANRGSAALPFVCDGKQLHQVRAAVAGAIKRFSTVDILINNAQQSIFGGVLSLTDSDYEDSWQSGPLAAVRFMRELHPYLRGGGVVINLGSASSLQVEKEFSAYASAKAAMLTISRAAAVEWAGDGVRVNVVLPVVQTEAMDGWATREPEAYEQLRSSIPLGRCGDGELDVGRAIVFLCGPDAAYITGTTLTVDGGSAYLR